MMGYDADYDGQGDQGTVYGYQRCGYDHVCQRLSGRVMCDGMVTVRYCGYGIARVSYGRVWVRDMVTCMIGDGELCSMTG